MIMGTDGSMGAMANILVGLVGAVIGRFLAPLVGMAPQGTDFSIGGSDFWRYRCLRSDCHCPRDFGTWASVAH